MMLLAWGIGLVLAGGAGSSLLQRAPRAADMLFRLCVVAGCALTVVPAVATLSGHAPAAHVWQPSLPGGAWIVALDPLSAWFLLLVAIVSAATAVYGVTYLAAERIHRPPALAHAGFALLVAAMMAVVVAQAAVLFLLAWEVMAVSAYFLIMFESDRPGVARAGLVYLALTHIGTLALFSMFLAWRGPAADLTFVSLSRSSVMLPGAGAAVLLLALVGFGIKAGTVPLHFWLPGAHAAAPSHVSALLSGIMIKMGIYGLLRVMVLLGAVPAWWGWTLLGLGLVSGILGVLWALSQHDLKRVLAYSSVENIGIILLGLGAGALGTAYREPVVAMLGLTAAVLHTLNHAVFKSLLFLGVGAVARETRSRALERLGGIGRRMPLTAFAVLVGSVAIMGLPPLNGFVSEWVLLQALLRTGLARGPIQVAVFTAAGIGVIAALAVACFSRVNGIVFLGRPRSASGAAALDPTSGMLFPMYALALGCVVLGCVPAVALRPVSRVVAQLARQPIEVVASYGVGMPSARAIGTLALVLAGTIIVIGFLRATLARRSTASLRRGVTWGCAYSRPTPRMQYTASSFGAPILAAFSLAKTREQETPTSFATDPEDRVFDRAVGPVWTQLRAAAAGFRLLQRGQVTTYLQYIVVTVIILLLSLFASTARRA